MSTDWLVPLVLMSSVGAADLLPAPMRYGRDADGFRLVIDLALPVPTRSAPFASR